MTWARTNIAIFKGELRHRNIIGSCSLQAFGDVAGKFALHFGHKKQVTSKCNTCKFPGRLSDTAPSFLAQWHTQSTGMETEPGQGLPGALVLQTEPVRVLYRPLAASLASPAKSTCCSVGSLARVCSSSHLPGNGGVQPLSHPQRTGYPNKPCAANSQCKTITPFKQFSRSWCVCSQAAA